MTNTEKHNTNVAAAKTAIENALEVTGEARHFAGQHNKYSGSPFEAFAVLDSAESILGDALEAVEDAILPVYDKVKENTLTSKIFCADPGSDERYELAKQLVAHMADRPKS